MPTEYFATIEPRRYDLWQAAELLGLAAPDKPNGWEL